ncbi:MAG: BrnT family toxin [Holosporales bacterium]|jgi:uncharacterized DUF497 family protein
MKTVYEWDEEKNLYNIAKHGIDFAVAKRIFEEAIITKADTRRDYGEPRFVSIGTIGDSVVVVVVYTQRNNHVRLISARRASRQERMLYNVALQKTDDNE